ncbi:hypothetical protein AAC387_Pa01g1187 [Persea americana]
MGSHLAAEFRANPQIMKINEVDSHPTRIRIFDRRPIFMMIARSVLLFVIIASFLWIGSILRRSTAISNFYRLPIDGQMSFAMLFQDLANVGLLTPGDRAVILSQGDCQHVLISGDLDLHPISGTDDQRSRSLHDNTLDFVFSHGLDALTEEFIAGALKIGGIAAVQVTDDMSDSFRIPLDFKIVYLRRLDPIVLAMRQTGRAAGGSASLTRQRRRPLLAEDSTKRGAVEGLEDLLLEPPRVAAVRSHRYQKRTKYLPDLTGDSLDRYARRVFVNVESSGNNGGGRRWFEENYPTKGGLRCMRWRWWRRHRWGCRSG